MMFLSAVTALSMVVFSATIYDTSAFSLSNVVSRCNTFVSQSPAVLLCATVADDATEAKITTGPDGKAALNYDEDLRLTLQIIMDHQRRSATVTTEQLVQQVTAAAAIIDDEKAVIDISIPYDAAARLAYDKESSSVKASTTFENYKIQYEANAVADVIAKKDQSKSAAAPPKAATAAVVTKEETAVDTSSYDISIPYDAAAKLAYEALSADERSKMEYNTFQQQYTEKAVADVIAKKASKDKATPAPAVAAAAVTTITAPATTTTSTSDADVSIPYDSAAKLAYSKLQSIKHSLTYEQFKQQYEKNAVLNVIAKKLKREQQA